MTSKQYTKNLFILIFIFLKKFWLHIIYLSSHHLLVIKESHSQILLTKYNG